MIHFLIVVLLIGAVIVLMANVPAFRNFVFAVVALIIGAFVLFLMGLNNESGQRERERAAEERNRLAAQQVRERADRQAFADFTAGKIKLDGVKLYQNNEYRLTGIAANDSDQVIGSFLFDVTITDCKASSCRIVGQQGTDASVYVPVGQARAFSSALIRFNNLPDGTGARRSWAYKVTGVGVAGGWQHD